MKVVRVCTFLDFGGIEKVFELQAKYHRKEYELVFLALSTGGRTEVKLRKLGFEVVIINGSHKIPSFSIIFRLVREFRRIGPDVVHTCGAEANFHGQLAAWLVGVPNRIAEEIGIPNHRHLWKVLFRILYGLSNRVIAVSKAVGTYLTKFEVPGNKVVVIYNPVDAIKLFDHGDKPGKFIIISVGRLEPIKNFKMLIDLVGVFRARYPDRSAELWLVGEGSQREELERYASSKSLESFVRYFGYLEHPETLLVKADVFVLPSLFEGFGLACIEAIQCRVPVIVSNSGGMSEYIVDGENGFLFDPASMEQLTDKIHAFLNMRPQEIELMTEKALETVNSKFSPNRYLDSILDCYNSIKIETSEV